MQKQQASRHNTAASVPIPKSAATTASSDHAELDILDSLDLEDTTPVVRLRHVLIDESAETSSDSIAPVSYTHLTLPTKRIV